jgi:hypothetical protein
MNGLIMYFSIDREHVRYVKAFLLYILFICYILLFPVASTHQSTRFAMRSLHHLTSHSITVEFVLPRGTPPIRINNCTNHYINRLYNNSATSIADTSLRNSPSTSTLFNNAAIRSTTVTAFRLVACKSPLIT